MADTVSVTQWQELEAAANKDTGDEGEDGFNIGRRDGFSEAVQLIDTLTGGDGEYRYCTVADDSHCPDPDAMIARIVARLASTQPAPALPRDEVRKIIWDAVLQASACVPERFADRVKVRIAISDETTDRLAALLQGKQP